MLPCAGKFASPLDAIPKQAQRFSLVNRSKPVLCVATSGATTEGKKFRAENGTCWWTRKGCSIRVKVEAFNITDRDGAAILLTSLLGHLPRLQLIWADSGYQGKFEAWVSQLLGGVRLEIVTHPWTGIKGTYAAVGEKVDWDKIIPKGFHILPRRWLIERTNAWITHSRRLSRDFAGTHSSSEAFIYLAMSKLMVARLARDHP